MTDEANSGTDEQELINQGTDGAADEAPKDAQASDSAPNDGGTEDAGKDTKTLLSGDEGDGAGEDEGGAPEAYEFTPPEGFEVNEEVQKALDAFGETAKGLGLSQDQYQKLVEFDIERGMQAQVAQATQYVERINGWADIVRADPELGGERLDANLSIAKRAIEAFGSPELSKLISAPSEKNPEGLGLGNHPEFIRFMFRVGRSIGEDGLIEGDGRKVDDRDALQRMYPTMFKEAV